MKFCTVLLALLFVFEASVTAFAQGSRAAASPSPSPASSGADASVGDVIVGDVIAEAARWIGAGNVTGKPGPWCASFASYVLQRTGRPPLANDIVSSALGYGRRLREPRVGSLAILSTRRGYAGHVGFVAGVNADGSIRLISGNWGRRVGDAIVSRSEVVAFVEVL